MDKDQYIRLPLPRGDALDDYQQKAISTFKFNLNYGLLYPALGLAGEAGETAEKVKKWLRDDRPASLTDRPGPTRVAAIKKELGDTLWYLAVLAGCLGLNLSDVARDNIEKITRRKEEGKLHGEGDDR